MTRAGAPVGGLERRRGRRSPQHPQPQTGQGGGGQGAQAADNAGVDNSSTGWGISRSRDDGVARRLPPEPHRQL